jgi:uncharacterized protein YegP (UPF0339 family)
MDKIETIRQLENSLERECADDLVEASVNLLDGTCDWTELIPVLEKIAEKDMLYYFDDNGAGGYPRPSGEPSSFRDWCESAIANIKENKKFTATGILADQLKCNDIDTIRNVIVNTLNSNCTDEKLIPILEKIAKKDKYQEYDYWSTWSNPEQHLGESAKNAIDRIKKNIADGKLKR